MKGTKGYLAVTDRDKSLYVQEEFKGEVVDDLVKFPKELGVEHPFEFEDAEKVFKTVGLVTGAISKIVDNIVGEFQVKCDNPNAKIIIDDFIKDTNLQITLREWIIEACVKGNGFLELDLKNSQVKVLNANDIYVVRDKKGNIKGYNQFVGKSMKNFNFDRHVVSFMPNQIAHLMVNKLAGDAYGRGLIMPNERVIENIVLNEQDLQKLISRKAGMPIHVSVGQPGEVTDPSAVDNIKNSLVYMTNRTEWVTDANVKMELLNFGEVGKNLTDTLGHNIRMLCAGMQIPEVMLNSGQLNEGIGQVQLEGFQRFIASIQEDIESIIEVKIFKQVLFNNSLDIDIEFQWNLPGEEEINLRLTQLNTMLQNAYLSDGMRRNIQIEMGRLLNFENPEDLVDTPNTQGMTADKSPVFTPDGKTYEPKQPEKETPKEEKEREEKIPQPEVPKAKQVKQETEIEVKEVHRHEITETQYNEMTVKEYVNIIEIAGFNYSDYLLNILKRLRTDKFEKLSAITEKDIEDGLLTSEQTEKLRLILKDGFRKNKTIKDIEAEIKSSLNLKDRIAENGAVISAEVRPNIISRTETLRLANLGLIDTYKQNGIEQCRWLSALSERTCEQCNNLNGQVLGLDEYLNIKADIHPNCRCTALSITA